jgi:hypothetical protein
MLEPTRDFNKGDQRISEKSGSVVVLPHHLWAIKSPQETSTMEDISSHLDFFRETLRNKINVLSEYKRQSSVEVVFRIWIETDNAGVGLSLSEGDLQFLESFSNRVHLTLLVKETLGATS